MSIFPEYSRSLPGASGIEEALPGISGAEEDDADGSLPGTSGTRARQMSRKSCTVSFEGNEKKEKKVLVPPWALPARHLPNRNRNSISYYLRLSSEILIPKTK